MSIRLNKALRELNIGLQTAVEFLSKRNDLGEVKAEPSFKLSDQQYKALNDAFSQDKEVRDQAEKLFPKKTKDKKRAPEQKDNVAEKVLEQGGKQKFTPLGKIDLDSIGKPAAKSVAPVKNETPKKKEAAAVSPASVNQASKAEVKTANEHQKVNDGQNKNDRHNKQNGGQNNGQQKQNKQKPMQNQANNNQSQQAANKPAEANASGSVFTLKSEKKFSANEPKVLGKIDLSSLNQSTRPKKKTKEERRKEREEKLAQQHSERKKRVRINKERVDINAEANQNGGGKNNGGNNQNGNNQNGGNKKKKNKNKNKNNNNNQRQIEVDDEAVARQVKETLARLTSKSQNKKGAKYRKEKREAVQEKLQDQARQEQKESKILKLTEFVTVSELATMMNISVTQVISTLMGVGIMVSINQRLDAETINMVAEEFGFKTEYVSAEVQEAVSEEVDDENDLVPRAPIVTVMGHVDHGKTSLLDAIRKTNVTAREAGGITQHIGAYKVNYQGKQIVFLDTPGHEAFTAMRARGAQVTDVAILVVAADDGVMPQTIEAINHAKAAKVPIIVAINKMDRPGANPDHVKQQLAEHELIPEDWGGDTIMVPVSAHQKTGITDLLEMILLVAEMQELRANPNLPAHGTIIEAQLDKGRGPVATVLVQRGTLHVGDTIIAGMCYGKVRAMVNDRGEKVKKALPSTPVEVLGLNDVPQAGDILDSTDEKIARSVAEKRIAKKKEEEIKANSKVSLDDLFQRIKEGELKELDIVVKADVQGTIEALKASLEKIKNDEVKVAVIHAGVGAINESDVSLASAANALIIGFNVRPDANARKAAETEKVDIRTYRVIYDAINDVEAAIKGMLAPKFKEVIQGRVEVRQLITISKLKIAGCYVLEGKVTNSSKVRVVRDGIVVHEGVIESLRRFKDDVKEVAQGYECGITLEKFSDLKEGDIFEIYDMEEIAVE